MRPEELTTNQKTMRDFVDDYIRNISRDSSSEDLKRTMELHGWEWVVPPSASGGKITLYAMAPDGEVVIYEFSAE